MNTINFTALRKALAKRGDNYVNVLTCRVVHRSNTINGKFWFHEESGIAFPKDCGINVSDVVERLQLLELTEARDAHNQMWDEAAGLRELTEAREELDASQSQELICNNGVAYIVVPLTKAERVRVLKQELLDLQKCRLDVAQQQRQLLQQERDLIARDLEIHEQLLELLESE